MNEHLVRRVWSMPMGPTRKAILVAMACHADEHGDVMDGTDVDRLSALTCVTVSAARVALAWLIDSSYVTKDRAGRLRVTGAGAVQP